MKPLLSIDTEMQIPFHDVDAMGVTWHGNYLRYFEIARCKLLDELGYNYRQMQASNYVWPIVDLQIKYIKPSSFEQKITVRAELVEWENRLKINYQIRDVATGARITKGYTIQAAVNMNSQELCFVTPELFRDKIATLLAKTKDE